MSIKKQFLKSKPVCKVTFRVPEKIGNSAQTAHVVGEFNDWSLIPAMAKIFEIPCLFTVQKSDTVKKFLSYIEDMGIDVAVFWQHLFYDRYPINYEKNRESNPVNFLLSGIYSASFVNTPSFAFLEKMGGRQNFSAASPFWEVLAEKKNASCAAVSKNLAESEQYLEIYQRLLQRSLLQSEGENFEINAVAH